MSPFRSVAISGNKMRPSKLSAERAGPRVPRDTLCSGQKSHGHDHGSYHRNHRSFARWRRLLWAGPPVVSLYGREQPAVIWSKISQVRQLLKSVRWPFSAGRAERRGGEMLRDRRPADLAVEPRVGAMRARLMETRFLSHAAALLAYTQARHGGPWLAAYLRP